MTDTLNIWANTEKMGVIRKDRKGRLTFEYDAVWRARPGAYPLSLSMPLVEAVHNHQQIEPFLWGLLPDNEVVLSGWAREFHVSARSAFGLLRHVGEDVSGALQFLPPDRNPNGEKEIDVKWLTASEIEERLRRLHSDPSLTRLGTDRSQFSLAGAQAKTALFFSGKRWGVPQGRTPTTHILKPPMPGHEGHIENEHACLRLAQELGIPAADSTVRRFGNQLALAVERFDRMPPEKGRGWHRLHQEDMCQAFGVPPERKYQRDGGPSPEDILVRIATHSDEPSEDGWRFAESLIFNWIIAGTDAHAKNYGFLIAEGPTIRLAPLYDVASLYCYPEKQIQKAKLAMSIGGEYRLLRAGRRNWQRFAELAKLPESTLFQRMGDIASAAPGAFARVKAEMAGQGIRHAALDYLAGALGQRCETVLRMIAAKTAA